MEKNLKLMLSGSYVAINQLIKSIWKVAHLEFFLLYMLAGKNINPIKNDQDKVQIWSFKSP
jgi:hypothetical protein